MPSRQKSVDWGQLGLIGSAIVGGFALASVVRHHLAARRRDTPPGDFGWLPVVGNSIEYTTNQKEFVQRRIEQHGSVFKVHVLGEKMVMLTDPRDYEFVTRNSLNGNLKMIEMLRDVVGSGNVIASIGAQHKHLRTLSEKYFGWKSMNQKIGTIREIMLDHIETWTNEEEVPESCTKAMCFEILMRIVFGDKNEFLSESECDELYKNILIMWDNVFAIPYLPYPFGYGVRERAKGVFQKILNDVTVRARGAEKTSQDETPSCFLEALLADETLAVTDVEDNIRALMVAGYESISTTMERVLYWAAKYKSSFSARLKNDVSTIGVDETGCPVAKELLRCEYLDAFVRECVRVIPNSATHVIRTATRDLEFVEAATKKKYTIPKGWSLMFDQTDWVTNEKGYPQGANFDPDFLVSNPLTKQQLAEHDFMWGRGPRTCLGKYFALMQLKLFAYLLVTGYDWDVKEGYDLKPEYCVGSIKMPFHISITQLV